MSNKNIKTVKIEVELDENYLKDLETIIKAQSNDKFQVNVDLLINTGVSIFIESYFRNKRSLRSLRVSKLNEHLVNYNPL